MIDLHFGGQGRRGLCDLAELVDRHSFGRESSGYISCMKAFNSSHKTFFKIIHFKTCCHLASQFWHNCILIESAFPLKMFSSSELLFPTQITPSLRV